MLRKKTKCLMLKKIQNFYLAENRPSARLWAISGQSLECWTSAHHSYPLIFNQRWFSQHSDIFLQLILYGQNCFIFCYSIHAIKGDSKMYSLFGVRICLILIAKRKIKILLESWNHFQSFNKIYNKLHSWSTLLDCPLNFFFKGLTTQ